VGEGARHERARSEVERELADRDDLDVRPPGRLASLAARDDEPSEAGSGATDAHFERAREALSRFDYAGATAHLREAVDTLLPRARTADGRARLASAHLELAFVLHVYGERAAAAEELRACVNVAGSCPVDASRYPPELLALHEEVTATDAATGGIHVTAVPDGATAALDGREVRPIPATFEDVAIGRHYVVVEREGYDPQVAVVNVAPRETARRFVTLSLAPRPERARAALRSLGRDGVNAEPPMRAFAAEVEGVDVVMVARLGDDEAELAAFDAHGQRVGDMLEVEHLRAGDVEGWLDQTFPRATRRFYERVWFWTPIAFALIAGAAVSVYAVTRTPYVALRGGATIRE
jgi:hypothetical protein